MKQLLMVLFVSFPFQMNAQSNWFAAYSDSVQLIQDANPIIEKFGNDAKNIIPTYPPKILVQKDTKPYLIFIDKIGVHLPLWSEVIPQQKQFFYEMGEDKENGKKMFGLFFNGFYLVHELGHQLESYVQTNTKNAYGSEYFANQIAILWWRKNGNQKELKQCYDLIINLLPKLKNPVPNGQSMEDFFTKNYEQAATDPYVYGYMQFNQFKKIYEDNSLPDFDAFIKKYKK